MEIFSDDRIDQQQRECFAAALDALARTGCIWIVATFRSDLYPKLTDLPTLLSLKEGDGQFDLLPPTMREIGQIIRLPAAAAGLRFEFDRDLESESLTWSTDDYKGFHDATPPDVGFGRRFEP